MADSKTYLNVPFAQKDAAKALGAKWDTINKKWYVPADKDIALFTQWQVQSVSLEPHSSPVKTHSPTNTTPGAITYASDSNFVAYNGDLPPWD